MTNRRPLWFAASWLALSAALPPPAYGVTIYVNTSATGTNTGTSWANAFRELRSALDAATPGAEIWVAQGSYRPDYNPLSGLHTSLRSDTFQLKNGVTVYGGFASGDTFSARNPSLKVTTLSGDLSTNDIASLSDGLRCFSGMGTAYASGCNAFDLDSDGDVDAADLHMTDNTQHVVTGRGCDITAVLDGFRISGGYADSLTLGGGGLSNGSPAGSPTIKNCTFATNLAEQYGGAMANISGSSPIVQFCRFESNVALEGGACYNVDSSAPVMSDSTFTSNRATGGPGRGGAVLNLDHSSPPILRCTFVGNAGRRGGALTNNTVSVPLVAACRFRGNTASGDQAYGGAVLNQDDSDAVFADCVFDANSAPDGGAMVCSLHSDVHLVSCTLLGNAATGTDLSGHGGGIVVASSMVTVSHCILWSNTADKGPQTHVYGGQVSLDHSFLQGGLISVSHTASAIVSGSQIFNEDPLLTPDGHLSGASPARDAGDLSYAPPSGATNDVDGETRVDGPTVDIGADEFIDSDSDGLPNWWESKYFVSPTAANPSDGVTSGDADSLSNLEEYEEYGGHPTAPPYYVNATTGNNSWNGLAPTHVTGLVGPKATIQAALNLAADGDTVLVAAPATYAAAGDFNLDFHNRSIILLRRSTGVVKPVIDCGGSARAIKSESVQNVFAVMEGFRIINGQPDPGGALNVSASRLLLKKCELASGLAADRADSPVQELRLEPRSGGTGVTHNMSRSAITLKTDAPAAPGTADPKPAIRVVSPCPTCTTNELDLTSSMVSGSGQIFLEPLSLLRILADPAITEIRSDVRGTGDVTVEIGARLTLGGAAVLNLSGLDDATCNLQSGGRLTVDGSLVLVDSAAIRNTPIEVSNLTANTGQDIINNDITLKQSSQDYGGQLVLQGSGTISCNKITSYGDRFMDLDPDPDPLAVHPTISNNQITVIVDEGTGGSEGTLLELRAHDSDCTGSCPSGLYPAVVTGRFENEQAENWRLEELRVKANAKVNLTNRQGFQYQSDTTYPETAYVKKIKLYPNSVLNLGLQRLYYETLAMVSINPQTMQEVETIYNGPLPVPVPFTFQNGSRIESIPLLGFSLGIIAMEDDTEFSVRVQTRTTDSSDDQPCTCDEVCDDTCADCDNITPDLTSCKEGQISRLASGVMEMRTKAPTRESATSVAAKGSFNRAAENTIDIAFDYLFEAGSSAELVVYISDDPDTDENLTEVARITPPPAGRAGAIGSGVFGVFSTVWPAVGHESDRALRNFTRGTYVQLELRGTDASVWIDNWDPNITCTTICADLDSSVSVTEPDYLLLVAEAGQSLANQDKGCLDLNRDGFADLSDMLLWDAFFTVLEGTVCSEPVQARSSLEAPQAISPTIGSVSGLVIAGKQANGSPDGFLDHLYNINTVGSCLGTALAPAGGTGSLGNGRIFLGPARQVYQISMDRGVVRLNDDVSLVPFQQFSHTSGTVTVGLSLDNATTVPLSDAAFHPKRSDLLYVVPVVVHPSSGQPYKAAARLKNTSCSGGTFCSLDVLYGQADASNGVNTTDLRELEVNKDGQYLFVGSSTAVKNGDTIVANNDYVLIFKIADGTRYDHALHDGAGGAPIFHGPTAMLASARENRLYLTSSIIYGNNRQTTLYAFNFNASSPSLTYAGAVNIQHPSPPFCAACTCPDPCTNCSSCGYCCETVAGINSITENTVNGTLSVIGFTAPYFDPAYSTATYPFGANRTLFTSATLSRIPAATLQSEPISATITALPALSCNDLALPLSVVDLTRTPDLDGDGDVDAADFTLFTNCDTRTAVPQTDSACAKADFDEDTDVDANDFAILQRCLGPSDSVPPAGCAP